MLSTNFPDSPRINDLINGIEMYDLAAFRNMHNITRPEEKMLNYLKKDTTSLSALSKQAASM